MPKLIQEVAYFNYTVADYQFSMQNSLVGGEIFRAVHTAPGTHPPSYIVGAMSFLMVKPLTTHPYLAPRLKKGWSYTFFPLCAFVSGYSMNFAFLCSTALPH
jgi:hypothetical protein